MEKKTGNVFQSIGLKKHRQELMNTANGSSNRLHNTRNPREETHFGVWHGDEHPQRGFETSLYHSAILSA